MDRPEYLIRWFSNERFDYNMKTIEDIAVTHKIPVQISHRKDNKEAKQFVYKRTVMSEIAKKDKEEMLVV